MGVQRKVDEAVQNICHEFKDVSIEMGGLVLHVESGSFSGAKGLILDALELCAGEQSVVKLENVELDVTERIASCQQLHVVLGPVLMTLYELVDAIRGESLASGSAASNASQSSLLHPWQIRAAEALFQSSSSSLNIQLSTVYLSLFQESQLRCQQHTFRCESLCVTDRGTLEKLLNVTHVVTELVMKDGRGTENTVVATEDGGCSPFDNEPLCVFRAQPKPKPLASVRQTAVYRAQERDACEVVIRLMCDSVSVTNPLNFAQSLKNIAHECRVSSSSDDTGGTPQKKKSVVFELQTRSGVVEKLMEGVPSLSVADMSCFVSTRDESYQWSGSIRSVTLDEVGHVDGLRIAGEDANRISVDISCLTDLLINSDTLRIFQTLAPPMEEDVEDVLDLSVRAKRARAAVFGWQLQGRDVEVFSVGEDLAITAGKMKTTDDDEGLRATVLQVLIGLMDGTIRVSAASLQGAVDPDFITRITRQFLLPGDDDANPPLEEKEKEEEEEKCNFTGERREDYVEHALLEEEPQLPPRFKMTVCQARIRMLLNRDIAFNPPGHVEIHADQFKVRIERSGRCIVSVDQAECLDRLAVSVWNKAAIVRGLRAVIDPDGEYSFRLGNAARRREEITISLDQNLLDWFGVFGENLAEKMHLAGIPPGDASGASTGGEEEEKKAKIRSVHISPFRARVDYKPRPGAEHIPGVLNYLPVRAALLRVSAFDVFRSNSWEDVGCGLAVHAMRSTGNLARVLNGVKPLRTPVDVFRNVGELVLVGTAGVANTVVNGQPLDALAAQARRVARHTAVSVLELGPGLMNVRQPALSGAALPPPSVHSNQPQGIKSGMVRAAGTFRREMNTAVAFITGDARNVDLFDLPLLMLRPMTAPVSDMLNGVCNQLDSQRLQRMNDKYG
jgi:hypothetical protein